jgi:hypothetical protein
MDNPNGSLGEKTRDKDMRQLEEVELWIPT